MQTLLVARGRQNPVAASISQLRQMMHCFQLSGNQRSNRALPARPANQISTALFGEALLVQDLLTYLLGFRPDVILKQDNEAVIKIVRNKYSAKFRHCGRVHRVNITSVSELVEEQDQGISLEYCNTLLQLAKPVTKILAPQFWNEALG